MTAAQQKTIARTKRTMSFDPVHMSCDFIPDKRIPSRPWVTNQWHAMTSDTVVVFVPPGFRSDFASVPGWLLWLFPPTGAHQRAALFHDALYAYQPTSRLISDAIFDEIMRQDGVRWLTRKAMYVALRLFGWAAWKENAKRSDEACTKRRNLAERDQYQPLLRAAR